MPTILLATGNVAKQAKLRWLIDGLGFDAVTPRDLGLDFDPPESGSTHQEVAASKALAWADPTGCLAIASDGGVDIPALGAAGTACSPAARPATSPTTGPAPITCSA